jgi:hypothetical protein
VQQLVFVIHRSRTNAVDCSDVSLWPWPQDQHFVALAFRVKSLALALTSLSLLTYMNKATCAFCVIKMTTVCYLNVATHSFPSPVAGVMFSERLT